MATPILPESTELDLADSLTENHEPEIVEKHEEETPTTSHALAHESINVEPEDKGACQVEHDDIRNLGWNGEARRVPQPVVGGLKNEELWSLVRRFDKQIFHVKSIDEPPLADLDMNIADDEEFSPDKLRAHLERLYVTVAVALFSFWKHIACLRSWREHRRRSLFLAGYTVAWLLDLLVPTIAEFLVVLTGGVHKPAAGVLASDDTTTGAAEKREGVGAEQEAHSFANSIATLVASTSAGKHPQGGLHDDDKVPDPTQLTEDMSNARDNAPVPEPLTQGLGFAVGFAFFSDPVLMPLIALVNSNYPKWQKYVELRNSILRGVPTNAQLAVTLLRIGEKNKAPVPPPPTSDVPPSVEPDTDAVKDLDHLGATNQEIQEAIEPESEQEDGDNSTKQFKKSRRLINLIKGTAKGGVQTMLTTITCQHLR